MSKPSLGDYGKAALIGSVIIIAVPIAVLGAMHGIAFFLSPIGMGIMAVGLLLALFLEDKCNESS